MRKIMVILLWVSLFINSMSAEVILKENEGIILLENSFFKMEIAPSKGGRVSSFILKPDGKDIVYEEPGGLFLDHIWQQTWPGELLNAKYSCQILKQTSNEVIIKLSYKATGKCGGEVNENVKDILIEKTYILKDEPLLEVKYRLTNTGEKGKAPGLWIQHCIMPGGDKDDDWYFRPSTYGLDIARNFYEGSEFKTMGIDFLRDPIAGWTVMLDKNKTEGYVFLLDYNYLQWLYTCLRWTTEWFYDRVGIPSNKFWETSVVMVPVKGFKSISHASGNVIADIGIKRDGNKLKIDHMFRATRNLIKEARIHTEIQNLDTNTKNKCPVLTFNDLGLSCNQQGFSIDIPFPANLLFQIGIEGDGISEKYEYLYDERITPPTLGATKLGYQLEKPAKHKKYLKPEVIIKPSHAKPNIMILEGLYYENYHLKEASAGLKDVSLKESKFIIGQFGSSLSEFPASYEELFDYDVVIMADVDAECIGDDGVEMLKEFVKAGGGLLLLGGPYTFGAGKMKGTQFDDVLPVVIDKTFDLKKGPFPLKKTKDTPAWLSFNDEKAVVMWKHDLRLKPKAVVWLTAGDEPFLIASNYGKGRVVICTGTVLGIPPEGKIGFWESKEWEVTVSGIIRWLLNENENP